MVSRRPDHWQIQDAKQRFSEMIRAVAQEGPQIITRHGKDVAVVVDIAEYSRLTRPAVDLAGILLGGPKIENDDAEVFIEIEAECKAGPIEPCRAVFNDRKESPLQARGQASGHTASARE